MFNFFSSIKKECFKEKPYLSDYHFQNDSGKYLYFEGIKKILTIENNMIVFSTKKNIINVSGKELFVAELSIGTIAIEGKIDKIEVVP